MELPSQPGRAPRRVLMALSGGPCSVSLSSGRPVPASGVCQDGDINALEQTCVNSALIRRHRHPVGLTPKGNLDPGRGRLVRPVSYLQPGEDTGPSGVSRAWPTGEGSRSGPGGRGERREVPGRPQFRPNCSPSLQNPNDTSRPSNVHQGTQLVSQGS